MRRVLVTTGLVLAGCSSDAGVASQATPSPLPSPSGSVPAPGGGDAGLDAPLVGGGDAGVGPPRPLPRLTALAETCKLISNKGLDDPTPNQTLVRANLRGTDLGIPVAHADTLYFFFGDSVGWKGIWQFGESQPDAVGFAPAAEVAKDPATLCSNLRFLGLAPNASVGPTKDATIERDFAAVSMKAPAGGTLADFIHNPAGHGAFPNLPGDFEVPSGAFSANGAIYVFYTTVDAAIQMKGSYLARWAAPAPTALPALDILYHVDQRFDANGALRGDFINIAALVKGDWVYLYGTGDYRKSAVHLARKKLAALDTEGGFERFDAATRTWKPGNTAGTKPIVGLPGIGELSVRYFASIDRFMMIDQEEQPGKNQIVARFAQAPEGPWSDGVLVADMGDPAFRAKYCCAGSGDTCPGEQLFHCAKAGFYGTYLLPDVAPKTGGGFTASFLTSTWDPYNVALMRAAFE